MHWRQKGGSSFSSGTASETTHDRYPMITPITATTVSQPQANSLSRIVHSDFESPKRETSVANLQHKPYSAVNPLTNPSAGTQQSGCRDSAIGLPGLSNRAAGTYLILCVRVSNPERLLVLPSLAGQTLYLLFYGRGEKRR